MWNGKISRSNNEKGEKIVKEDLEEISEFLRKSSVNIRLDSLDSTRLVRLNARCMIHIWMLFKNLIFAVKRCEISQTRNSTFLHKKIIDFFNPLWMALKLKSSFQLGNCQWIFAREKIWETRKKGKNIKSRNELH